MQDPDTENGHQPVLLDETLDLLNASSGGLFIDATLGLGGHSEAILEASTDTVVIGIDQDEDALRRAKQRLSRFDSRISFIHSNFAMINDVVRKAEKGAPAGILADLGVSSLQLDSVERGFSLRHDAPLDMRMDPASGGQTAAELLGTVSQDELANIIYNYGEERASRKIARWIVEKRESGTPVNTTSELADLVKRAVRSNPKDRTHPATRTFQALRIAVNGELDILEPFIKDSVDLLASGGVLAIISFHSLEDRIVKHAFQRLSGKCVCPPRQPVCSCGAMKRVEILTRKPVLPSQAESKQNPRSHSAKLRACRKLDN
jgi:16S rRNA (cytosine1402-N4)-methyltransferase